MKLLLGCVLLVLLSGCIPIGIQGKTSANPPGSGAVAPLPGADRAANGGAVSA
jgi:hypothetical protein